MRLINRTLDALSEQDIEAYKGLMFDAMEIISSAQTTARK
jgi:hypothetical protein